MYILLQYINVYISTNLKTALYAARRRPTPMKQHFHTPCYLALSLLQLPGYPASSVLYTQSCIGTPSRDTVKPFKLHPFTPNIHSRPSGPQEWFCADVHHSHNAYSSGNVQHWDCSSLPSGNEEGMFYHIAISKLSSHQIKTRSTRLAQPPEKQTSPVTSSSFEGAARHRILTRMARGSPCNCRNTESRKTRTVHKYQTYYAQSFNKKHVYIQISFCYLSKRKRFLLYIRHALK